MRVSSMYVPEKSRSIDLYMKEVNKFKLLTKEQEQELAFDYMRTKNPAALQQLVNCNLRFVVKMAHKYNGYGLGFLELVQEGNLGLIKAVQRFNPERGYRFTTYAVWWIRAHMQNFVIKNWSLVRMGTTQVQRKLFYKLRNSRNKAEALANGESVSSEDMAELLGVKPEDITDMEIRFAHRDYSLDTPLDSENYTTHLDMIEDETSIAPDKACIDEDERVKIKSHLEEVMRPLSERERYVVEKRIMADEPLRLHEIASVFGISRERVRQIEENVLYKIRYAVKKYERKNAT